MVVANRLDHALVRGWSVVLMVAAAMALPVTVRAQSNGFSGVAALSSQLVDRGIAVTPSTPILQGAAAWTSPSGWSLGLSASTEVRSPGHIVEALAQASRSWSLSSDWQMQGGLLYYSYPGNGRARAYDRAELGVSWIYRDILTFGVSAAHVFRYGSQSPRAAADVTLHWPLFQHVSLSAGAGWAQTLITTTPYSPYPHYGYHPPSHYAYGHAGLSWSNGPWQIELDRIITHPDMHSPGSSLNAAPWVATLSRSF